MDTSSTAEFKNSLNDTINIAVREFKYKYKYLFNNEIEEIIIKEDNAIGVTPVIKILPTAPSLCLSLIVLKNNRNKLCCSFWILSFSSSTIK